MAHITTPDGTKLWVEEAGTGTPILFIHEFGGDHRSWEPQLRFFARRHRCITFAARGYPPSDVPGDIERYSQAIAAADAVAVLDGLGIAKAHIVGLSMGGFCALHVGLSHASRALSIVAAGAGYGAEKALEEYFRGVSLAVASVYWLRDTDSANFLKIISTVSVWAAYAVALGLRLSGRLLARRFAWTCLLLFPLALLSLQVVNDPRPPAAARAPAHPPAKP